MFIVCKNASHTAKEVLIAHLGNKVTMAASLHHHFHTSQDTPTVNPNNVVVLPQDPKRQQQEARETSPPAGTTCFLSNLLISCHKETICFSEIC